jgi:hypothetical protein
MHLLYSREMSLNCKSISKCKQPSKLSKSYYLVVVVKQTMKKLLKSFIPTTLNLYAISEFYQNIYVTRTFTAK